MKDLSGSIHCLDAAQRSDLIKIIQMNLI